MTKLIKDPKTGLTRPSRKIAAKIRDIADGEISAMLYRIKWRKKKLKQYGAHELFNPGELNPDFVYTHEPARAADYWNEGRMIG